MLEYGGHIRCVYFMQVYRVVHVIKPTAKIAYIKVSSHPEREDLREFPGFSGSSVSSLIITTSM